MALLIRVGAKGSAVFRIFEKKETLGRRERRGVRNIFKDDSERGGPQKIARNRPAIGKYGKLRRSRLGAEKREKNERVEERGNAQTYKIFSGERKGRGAAGLGETSTRGA